MLRANDFAWIIITGACVVGTLAHADEPLDQSQSAQRPSDLQTADTFHGRATWYGEELHGHRTASGKPFDMNKLTAAHPALPFGTKVLVKNEKTGLSCLVEINDRCPPKSNRVIDVSREAARQLGILPGGEARVECIVITSDSGM
jgi:rare lipoprotein A